MTTKVYYNEWDSYCAQWLRNLIDAGHLPSGDVDERSITDVEPEELKGYTQHHFFAGIGGWALAARLAGVSESERIVTGSPPCQPFSTAGQRKGYSDQRHLAPHWLRLVSAIRPTWVFGEQVAAAIKKDDWLDDLLDALEAEGYSTGATVLPACSVGAPHIRQRLWVTARLVNSSDSQCEAGRLPSGVHKEHDAAWNSGAFDGLQRDEQSRGLADAKHDGHRGSPAGEAEPCSDQSGFGLHQRGCPQAEGESGTRSAENGWDDPDWLLCRDGKWRPVESGTFPLANGVPGRVGRLRAYGNAIVPQVAAEVIKGAISEY